MRRDQFNSDDASRRFAGSEPPTRRNFVAGMTGVALGLRTGPNGSSPVRAGDVGGTHGKRGDERITRSTHDGEPLDATPSFIDSHALFVEGPHFDRVELQMSDGATEVFMVPWPDDDHDRPGDPTDVVFGFSSENGSGYEHWAEIAAALDPYHAFNGPIERAEISTYEGDSETISNDVEGAIDSVEFTRSSVTVSVVGDEWKLNPGYVSFRFTDGSMATLTDVSIYGRRTFEFSNEVIETAQFGAAEFELRTRNVDALDEPDWKTLTVDGRATESRTDYRLQVSGELKAERGVGTGDNIRGSTAEGYIQGGIDEYRCTGRLEQFDLSGGDAILYVDGHRRDAA